uniref:Uncharacterized protein n=1 Tax=Dictyoglomus thermophilum TaxID=14 RepID=A0A7C3MP69_DICTH
MKNRFNFLHIFLITIILLTISIGKNFSELTFAGITYPYQAGILCHDGDYVRFYCDANKNNYFSYMTSKSKSCYIEFYTYNEQTKQAKGEGSVVKLIANQYIPSTNLNSCNFKIFYIPSKYYGKIIEIHFVENRSVGGVNCPENDLIIKLPHMAEVRRWRKVESPPWCDLDIFGLYSENDWKNYANSVADIRLKQGIESIFGYNGIFQSIKNIKPNEVYTNVALNSILSGIADAYLPSSFLDLINDWIIDNTIELASVIYEIQKTALGELGAAYGDVLSAGFMAVEYVQWTKSILWEKVPLSIQNAQEAKSTIENYQNIANSLYSTSYSQYQALVNLINQEKTARLQGNKLSLLNALQGQKSIYYKAGFRNNPKFLNDNISDSEGLPLIHIALKAYRIAQRESSRTDIPKEYKNAWKEIKLLSKKLTNTYFDLFILTDWVLKTEKEKYLLKNF